MKYKVIVIGASAGGLNAFVKILSKLPKTFKLPILLAQHLLEQENSYLANHLDSKCSIKVVEAEDKEKILPGKVYVCPAGYHMLVEDNKTISLSVDPPINYSRPSIDLLFETVAAVFKDAVVGVILTGANRDGANGLKLIHEQGGLCIVENPKTAATPFMPEAAISSTKVDYVLNLDEIGAQLQKLGL